MFRKKIYHYCNLSAFESIITSQSLWFKNLYYMSDTNEVVYRWKTYIECLRKSNPNMYLNYKNEYDHILESVEYFSLCLTKKCDSLRLWKEHADDGKGVMIAFDKTRLREWAGYICRNDVYERRILKSEGYKEGEVRNSMVVTRCDDVIYVTEKRMDHMLKRLTKSYEHENKGFEELEKLIYDAPFTKKRDFVYEDEVRVLITLPISQLDEHYDTAPYACKLESPGIKATVDMTWRTINSRNFPVFEMPFNHNMICDIVIGPNCERSNEDIVNLLNRYGYPVETINIKKSSIKLYE